MTWDAVPSAVAYQAELVPGCTGPAQISRRVFTPSIIMTLAPGITSCVRIAGVDARGVVGTAQDIRVTVQAWTDARGHGVGYVVTQW
jgi:hypothetical protein